jgi:hypothetical protein
MSTAKDDLAPEMEALKAKLKATWMSGDFDKIAQIYAPGAAEFDARKGPEETVSRRSR